jgi:hypothetical protein
MPKSKGKGRSRSRSSKEKTIKDKQIISARTKKQIDSLPEHAQHIYKKSAC